MGLNILRLTLLAMLAIPAVATAQITPGAVIRASDVNNALAGKAANDLSNLSNPATARGNLGLGSLATQNSIGTGQITGLAPSATTDTTNAANIASGMLSLGRLPALSGGDAYTAAGSGAITLNAVNGSPGSYGASTSTLSATVNAKGLVTALTATAIPTATASQAGLVKPDGASILNSAGVLSVTPASVGALNKAGDTATGVLAGVAPAYGDDTTKFPTTAWEATQTPCKEIDRYGADHTGQADNTSALTSAVAASQVSGVACVRFGVGTYKFTSTQSITPSVSNSRVTLEGAGANQTLLSFPSNGGITLNLNSIQGARVAHLSCLAGVQGGGTCINLNETASAATVPAQPLSVIEDVDCRGVDGYAQLDYWTHCLATDVPNVNIVNDTFTGSVGYQQKAGSLVYLYGSSSFIATVFNFWGDTFTYCNYCVELGANEQGVVIDASNFLGYQRGVYVDSGVAGTSQLTIGDSQFGGGQGPAFDDETGVPFVMLHNNLVYILGNFAGFQLTNAYDFSIMGNSLFSNSSYTTASGVTVTATNGGNGGVITGNIGIGIAKDVVLGASATYVNVQSNFWKGYTTAVTNSGTNNTVGGGSN